MKEAARQWHVAMTPERPPDMHGTRTATAHDFAADTGLTRVAGAHAIAMQRVAVTNESTARTMAMRVAASICLSIGWVTDQGWSMGTMQYPGWGRSNEGQITSPPNLVDVSQVACGYLHTYVRKSDGALLGWGYNYYGQTNTPANLGMVMQVACGGFHTYALRNDGSLIGWGWNGNGQINTPTALTNATQVTSGSFHNCATRIDGTVVSWGFNNYGQTSTPASLGPIAQVACGANHTYALHRDGTLVGWGNDANGQTDTPANLGNVAQVACGSFHTYALLRDGTLIGWGANVDGQINTPANLSGVIQISCGHSHTYALKSDGMPVGWGSNGNGQTILPIAVASVKQIACGGFHTYALQGWSDCNGNGIFDGEDIAYGGMSDLDGNNQPDICQGATPYISDSGNLGPPNPLAPASFTFSGMVPTDMDVPLLVNAVGDFDDSNEFLTVRVSDPDAPLGYQSLGRLFELGAHACNVLGSNAGFVNIPCALFNRLAQTGSLTVTLIPSPAVTRGECPNGTMSVRLNYTGIGPGGDCDEDGRLDVRQLAGSPGLDSNRDGHLDSCSHGRGDLDLNGEVDTADLSLLLLSMGDSDDVIGDFDGDGIITTADLSMLLLNFGPVTWP